jgi:DHA2 family multidrug resistance protein
LPPLGKDRSHVTVSPWLIALIVSLATFMEVMDTSIANVALRYIAGSVAASQSESTWVLTSYLVSNAIILPISGWLSAVIGRKRFYMSCVALFTISSFCCGLAPNLGTLLFFRVLQGIGGGGLAPSEQAILTDTFEPQQRGLAFALYGLAVVVAPAIGPALGGWITDSYSWRWIFFINIPVGILSLFLVGIFVQDSKDAKEEHAAVIKKGIKVDYVGFGLVALGLGCLQIVLDKGQEDDWFGSHFITIFAMLAAIGLIGTIVWELFVTDDPIVDLSLFKDVGFFTVNVMMFAVFFVLLSTTQLLPQLAQELLGYNATKAGLTLMPGGFVIMCLMPVVGILVRKVQPKYLICFGFLASAFALYYLMGYNSTISFWTLAEGRMLQTAGVAFLFVPINTIAFTGLPPGKTSNASALTNLMRNLGGSVGISVATTLLARRSQVHQNFLARDIYPSAARYLQQLHGLTHVFMRGTSDLGQAHQRALAVVSREVAVQSSILSYIDVFQVLLAGCVAAAIGTIFLKRIDPSKAQAGH